MVFDPTQVSMWVPDGWEPDEGELRDMEVDAKMAGCPYSHDSVIIGEDGCHYCGYGGK